MKVQHAVKKTLFWASITLLAFLCSFTLLLALMQTDRGRKETARVIGNMLSEGDQSNVVITGLKGRFPFHFQVGRISWCDMEGARLTAEGLTVRWSPWDLLGGIVRVKTLHASALAIERTPRESAQGSPPSAGSSPWLTVLKNVRLENFLVERLSLGEGLLGEAAVLRAEGWLKSAPREQEASVTVNRLDRKGTSLDAHVLLQDGRLTLDVKAQDRGDLLARVIGLEGPVSFSLQGEGKLGHWQGSMDARAEAYGELRSTVVLEAERDVVLSAAGSLHLRREDVFPALSHWIGGETPFDLEAVMTKENLEVRRFKVHREDAELTLAGSVNLRHGKTDGRFALSCVNLEPLSQTINRRVDGACSVEGTFSGMISQPVVNAEINIEHLALDDSQLSSLQGNLHLTFFDQTQTQSLRLRVRGSGDLRGLKVRSLHEEHALWVLDLNGPLEKKVAINELEFRGKSFSLHATGDLGIEEPLSFALHLRGKWALPVSFSSLKPYLGDNIDYEGEARLEGEEPLSVSRAVLKTSAATLLGNGTYDLRENIVHASWSLAVPRLQVFAPALGYPVEGSARFSGTTEGPLGRLNLKAEGRGKDILVRGLPIETVEVHVLAHGTPAESEGEVSFSLMQPGQTLKSRAVFALGPGKIFFPRFTLEGPETKVDGRIEVTTEPGRLSGRMRGECRDLSALSPWLGEKLEGEAVLDADFVLADTGAGLSLTLEAEDLSAPHGKARRVRVKAQVKEPMTAPRGRLDLDLTEARLGGWFLNASSIHMDGDLAEARFQAFANGHGSDAFELQGSGSVFFLRRSMRWEALKGFYRETPVRLASPLFIEIKEEAYTVRGLSVRLGAGFVEGEGRMEKRDIDLQLAFQDVALDSLPSPLVSSLSGDLSGRFTLRGTPAQPVGTWAIRASGLKTEGEAWKKLPPLLLDATGDFQAHRLTANLSLKGLTSEPVEGRLTWPLDFSLSPFHFSVPSQEPLEGSFTGKVSLESLAGLFGVEEQTVKGQGNIELLLGGTVEAPALEGLIQLNDGAYENLRTGTVLSRVQIRISAQKSRLRILEARAADGENGGLSAEGWLDIAPKQDFPLNAVLRLDRARLFRHDQAVATLSGTLSLEGSLRETALSGRVHVDSSDFRIPDRLPHDIAEVEVIEINKKETEAPPLKIREKKDIPWPVNLDVVVESSGRTFVRGRGLNSEWQGQVRVSGKASQPSVTGSVSVVRGNADFLGKNFDLKRGTIAFGGNFPPSPFIDVTAEAKAKDITAQLSIVGILPSPDIKLSSQPLLPEDEILARLLFGRSAKSLTPIQALQLADALNTLSGGGMDLLGRSRRFLGVDQLAVKNTGEKFEDSAVSAGKYVTEDVYIEVEKGISPETGKASLKWDATPNVTVDTEVGINAETGLGIQWKWDY